MSKELHFSLDAETLAADTTRPVFLSFALVMFDPDQVLPVNTVAAGRSLHVKFNLDEAIADQVKLFHRVRDEATWQWWQEQGAEARALFEACRQSEVLFRQGFELVNRWLSQVRAVEAEAAEVPKSSVDLHVWSYGARSDLTWWATACEELGLRYPVHYRNEHCLRTLADELPEVPKTAYGVKHDAWCDAVAQAAWIQRLRSRIGALRANNLSLKEGA